jgi:hypothetical protein
MIRNVNGTWTAECDKCKAPYTGPVIVSQGLFGQSQFEEQLEASGWVFYGPSRLLRNDGIIDIVFCPKCKGQP